MNNEVLVSKVVRIPSRSVGHDFARKDVFSFMLVLVLRYDFGFSAAAVRYDDRHHWVRIQKILTYLL